MILRINFDFLGNVANVGYNDRCTFFDIQREVTVNVGSNTCRCPFDYNTGSDDRSLSIGYSTGDFFRLLLFGRNRVVA